MRGKSRYLVTRPLPWIDGGRLHAGPEGLSWIGGEHTVYGVGDSVVVDDREVPGLWQFLEATNDEGRAVLEAARAEAEAPAERTWIGDLHPKTVEWLSRALDKSSRRHGRIRELVLRLLACGTDPTLDDLAAALSEAPGESIPQDLLTYVATMLGGLPRKPGPKGQKRTATEEIVIQTYYQIALAAAPHSAESKETRAFADLAANVTAEAFGIGKRTVQRVVAERHWKHAKE